MEAITRAMLARWYRIPSRLFILDTGCGTGAAATFLADYGTVTGIDIHPLALKFSRKRNLSRLARASVSALPFDSSQFDLVTSFDVLYERAVTDDLAALREFVRVLVPGGRVFLRLPAYDWLRGQHDKVVHTNKRYTANRVARLLAESGLSVERVSFANMFLFPVASLKRLGERLFPVGEENSDLDLNIGLLNGILLKILSSEAPLVATRGLPFGLSVVAVARKG